MRTILTSNPAITEAEQARRRLAFAVETLDEFLKFGPHPEWAVETPEELQRVLDLIAGAQRNLRGME